MVVTTVLALRTPTSAGVSVESSLTTLGRWGLSSRGHDEARREDGGYQVVHRCATAQAQFLVEPGHPYVLVRLVGDEEVLSEVSARAKADVWERDGLLRAMTQTDPPDASLLVTVALVTEQLDEETVEFFIRALEAGDAQTRKQAIVAISLVPALAFAPALRIAASRETDKRLGRMLANVLEACES